MRQSYRRLATRLAVAAVVPLISVCTDSAISPGSRAKSVGLSISPAFSASATNALQAYRAAGLDIDRVRITIVRPPSEMLSDQEVLLAGRGQQFAMDFTVAATVGEVLTARVEFRSGTTPLFAGSRSVVARAVDDTSTAADQIDVLPIGPGATAARVTVTPASGSFPTTAPVAFTARAFDQANNELTGALFTWSVDNAAVASVNASGVVQPTAFGGPLRVRATTLNSVTGEASVTFAVLPGHLALATQPGGATSGVSLATQPVVQIRDASNNLVSTSSVAVTAAIATGSGTLVGTKTVNTVNGAATFTDLRIDGGGSHTLTFTATGLAAVTSGAFTVTQSITALVVQIQPGGATSGRPFTTQPVVQIVDNTGIVVASSALPVTVRIASGTGTLSGTTTVNASNGVATFSDLRIDGSGPHTLSFSTATPALQVASASFTVGAAPPTQLAITRQPGGAVSGVALANQPVIEVRDASNNPVASSNVAITALIVTGSGTLVGTTTVSATNGIATFTNLRINGVGVHALAFSAVGLTGATSASVTVTQTAASLSIQTQPGGATSGLPLSIQPVIRVLDNAGLPVENAIGVTAAITSGTGTLSGTTSVTPFFGVATFTNLRIDGSGPQVLTFFVTNPALQIASAPFAVGSAGATQLVITTQPAGAVSGVNLATQPVVEARDANNVLVLGSAVAVTATIASGPGTLVGTTTVPAQNGVATFTNLRINGAGVHALNFSASGLTGARSGSLTVTQSAAALAIQTQPGGAASGSPLSIQPVIRILDNAGILIAGSTLPVTATVTSGNGALLGTTTVASAGGTATFTNLRVDGSGPQVLTFSTAAPALQIASATFAVGTAAPTQLVITRQPSGAVSGVDLTTQPVVEVRDANNNLVTGTPITVTASIAAGTGTLVGATSAGAVNGVAMFTSLRINGAGPHTLMFSAGSLTPATSASFVVTQSAASLAILTQPGGGTSGVPLTIQPAIRILDNAGLVVSGSTLAVTATIATGNGTIVSGGTANAVNGVATFGSLQINGAGPHTLSFTATGLAAATSTSFTVTQTPASVVIQTQPAGATSGAPLTVQPVIRIRDNAGILIATSTLPVTAAITSGSGTLLGTTTISAVGGLATFTNLRVDGTGAQVLTFSTTPPALQVASAPFAVSAPSSFSQLSVGLETACALTTSGAAYCWGNNQFGQLGDGTITNRSKPTRVVSSLIFVEIRTAGYHTCGRTNTGATYCWGSNQYGELGDGTTTAHLTPTLVSGGLSFVEIAAGQEFSCGRTGAGGVYCWGRNDFGQVGDGTNTARSVPTQVTGGLTFANLTAGGVYFACARTAAGAAYCWGWNGYGGIGDGTTTNHSVPTLVTGGLSFIELAAGGYTTCGRVTNGQAYCWGQGDNGELGNGSFANSSVPVQVTAGAGFTKLLPGGQFACALSGTIASCWGRNAYGELGEGTTSDRTVPTLVKGGLNFVEVATGIYHACGRTAVGDLYCWGRNESGEVGDGTSTDRLIPTLVLPPPTP